MRRKRTSPSSNSLYSLPFVWDEFSCADYGIPSSNLSANHTRKNVSGKKLILCIQTCLLHFKCFVCDGFFCVICCPR